MLHGNKVIADKVNTGVTEQLIFCHNVDDTVKVIEKRQMAVISCKREISSLAYFFSIQFKQEILYHLFFFYVLSPTGLTRLRFGTYTLASGRQTH
jgi:hypothetical protein